MNFKSLFFILPFIALFSCTVQKRHYQKGYFISWKKKPAEASVASRDHSSQKEKQKTTVPSQVINNPSIELEASTDNVLKTSSVKKNLIIFGTDTCDVIVYKDGSEIRIKIIEVSGTQVKYKRCDMPDGPSYITNKTELFMIQYASGTKEVIKAPEPVVSPQGYDAPYSGRKLRFVKKNTKLATVGLVFGILGFYPLIIVGGIVAIITGYIQLMRVRMDPERYGAERKAVVDIILGAISVAAWASVLALAFLL